MGAGRSRGGLPTGPSSAAWQIVALGCLGGMLPDVLRLIANRHDPAVPADVRSPLFGIGFVFLVALGGGMAVVLNAAGATLPRDGKRYRWAGP